MDSLWKYLENGVGVMKKFQVVLEILKKKWKNLTTIFKNGISFSYNFRTPFRILMIYTWMDSLWKYLENAVGVMKKIPGRSGDIEEKRGKISHNFQKWNFLFL
jgi:hypothetical protein